MLERWDALAQSGEPFDVVAEMTRLTLAIVAKALFSADVSDDAEAIGAALTEVNRQLGEFSLLDMFWMIPTPRKRRFRAAVRALDEVVGKIIDRAAARRIATRTCSRCCSMRSTRRLTRG